MNNEKLKQLSTNNLLLFKLFAETMRVKFRVSHIYFFFVSKLVLHQARCLYFSNVNKRMKC